MQIESLISFGPNYFIMMIHCEKKCDLRPLYFAQKCPQNAGNAVLETQILMPSGPPRIVSSLLQVGPRTFFCALWPSSP